MERTHLQGRESWKEAVGIAYSDQPRPSKRRGKSKFIMHESVAECV